nr:hypothetical protein [Candidatus Sigynarchaeota archaeon]
PSPDLARDSQVEQIKKSPVASFVSRVFDSAALQDIIRGWLSSSGSLNVSEAAKALNVSPMDIKLYLFDQAGKGIMNIKFKDEMFWIPESPQKSSSDKID